MIKSVKNDIQKYANNINYNTDSVNKKENYIKIINFKKASLWKNFNNYRSNLSSLNNSTIITKALINKKENKTKENISVEGKKTNNRINIENKLISPYSFILPNIYINNF